MVKPLAFKGDKKSKKRKTPHSEAASLYEESSNALTVPNTVANSEDGCNWVTAEAATDVTGPVIFALPSARPTSLACDTNGKVFAIELEDIIDSNLATAEPHDVRQVWIASKVAGTEEFSFKGHHGR